MTTALSPLLGSWEALLLFFLLQVLAVSFTIHILLQIIVLCKYNYLERDNCEHFPHSLPLTRLSQFSDILYFSCSPRTAGCFNEKKNISDTPSPMLWWQLLILVIHRPPYAPSLTVEKALQAHGSFHDKSLGHLVAAARNVSRWREAEIPWRKQVTCSRDSWRAVCSTRTWRHCCINYIYTEQLSAKLQATSVLSGSMLTELCTVFTKPKG